MVETAMYLTKLGSLLVSNLCDTKQSEREVLSLSTYKQGEKDEYQILKTDKSKNLR